MIIIKTPMSLRHRFINENALMGFILNFRYIFIGNNFLDNTTWRNEEEVYGDSAISPSDVHTHDSAPATPAISFSPRPPVPPTPTILRSDKKSNGGRYPPSHSQDPPGSSPPQIRYSDFTEINGGFGPGPCESCGSKWVNYQERMTGERMKRPPHANKKICKHCYEIAKQAESLQVRALPGVLSTATMQRVHNDRGRCQICNVNKEVWYDSEMKTAVCDSCYHITSSQEGVVTP